MKAKFAFASTQDLQVTFSSFPQINTLINIIFH